MPIKIQCIEMQAGLMQCICFQLVQFNKLFCFIILLPYFHDYLLFVLVHYLTRKVVD